MCHQVTVTGSAAGACVAAGSSVAAGASVTTAGSSVAGGGASVAGAPHAVSANETMSRMLKIMVILRDISSPFRFFVGYTSVVRTMVLTNAQVFLPSVQGRREGLQFICEIMMFSPPFS